MTFENIGFVEFAGEAPRSREIDENRMTLGLRLFHVGDLSIQILVWHLLMAVVLSIAASRLGRYLLGWRSLMARAGNRYAATP